MNLKRVLAAIVLPCLLIPLTVKAVDTNTWPFFNPNQYVVSDPDKIEVANDVARLKLQAERQFFTTIDGYLTNTATIISLNAGPDVSIGLQKSGALYQLNGQYTSRVFDGGGGNTWKVLTASVANQNLNVENVTGGISTNTSGLVALYRLDSTWTDAISGLTGTPVGSPTFTPSAKFGSAAASFSGANYYITPNSTLLHGATEFTYSLWAKVAAFPPNGTFLASRGATFNAVYLSGQIIQFYFSSQFIQSPPLSVGQWNFIVCTWRSSDGAMKIYINGVLGTQGTKLAGATFNQSAPFQLAADSGSARTACILDDVAILNRALTQDEITSIYQQATAVKFQVRSGSSAELSTTFSGPDGSADGYYNYIRNTLQATANFQPTDRYAQYRVFLSADVARSNTPWMAAAGFEGTGVRYIDDVQGDFLRGEFTANTTNIPAKKDTPYLGLAKNVNGGYYPNGTFTSRVLDGGSGVNWNLLSWKTSDEISTNVTSGLEGLYHVERTWTDSSGKGRGGAGINVTYTEYAKLGRYSAVFNGGSSKGVLSSMPSINTVEFWVRNDNVSDGLLELVANTTYLMMSNRVVVPVGFPGGASVTVYVNANVGGPLISGWNHVAVVSDKAVINVVANIGVANGDYMEGQMDEVALYSRALASAEVASHFVMGRRAVAGKVRLQVRTDTNNPPTGSFMGPDNQPGYFEDGAVVPASLSGYTGPYLQYQATLEGDGTATPALDSVTVTYNSSARFVETDVTNAAAGTFDAGQTRWYGDELTLRNLGNIGVGNASLALIPNLVGLWHMDDPSWTLDSSNLGNHGTPEGDAKSSTDARVGSTCGSFDGSGDCLSLTSIELTNSDFTVAAWIKTSSSTRSAVISSAGGSTYFTLEVNGNGVSTVAGAACFILNDGSGTRIAVGNRTGLNDSQWHHLAGVRNGRQMHLYIDGVLAGTTALGSSYGLLQSAQIYIAKRGTESVFYQGLIDEALLARRALTEAEIGSLAGAGAATWEPGSFTSPVFGGDQLTIWEKLGWGEDAPYSRPQAPGDTSLMLLWHLDAFTNTPPVTDDSGQGNHGTLPAGGTVVTNGRFGGALSLAEGSSQYATVGDDDTLETGAFSVEAWIHPQDALNHVVIDKRNATAGYRLALDASGRPYFWLNNTVCTQPDTVRIRQWTHIAGIYDGVTMRLYVNGQIKASTPLSAASPATLQDFRVGLGWDGTLPFFGRVDEVAVYDRALSTEEALDHYRAGAVTLRFQVRSWTTGGPGPFVGPGSSAATYFTTDTGSLLLDEAPLNQYFQFQASLASEDFRWTPRLQGMRIDTSRYPQDHPYVVPADGFGQAFPGNLTSFSHVLATNTDAAVRYQVSGNNGTNWFYWNGAQWTDVTGLGWGFANGVGTIQANINTLFAQLYPKTGGTFTFKAFLHSDGYDQTSLDLVRLGYSTGRILVTVPNGEEIGAKAWLVGVTNIIEWTSTGASGTVAIEWSANNGGVWQTVNLAAPNTGRYAWLNPGTGVGGESTQCLVRVRDVADDTIRDVSDANFTLAYRYKLVTPNGGEKWYIGTTNGVVWQSPPGIGSFAWLHYNPYGSTSGWARINNLNIPNTPTSTNNIYQWSIPTTNVSMLSENARMRITISAASTLYEDVSDNDYVLAGIGFIEPTAVTAWKRGSTQTLRWISSGAGSGGVNIEFAGDGVTFSNIATAVANGTGTNTYDWVVAADNPTPIARIRITAVEDPLVRNTSDPFTVADVQVLRPTTGDVWPQGTTNDITWTAGGAGNSVNIYYSTNDGVDWTTVQAGYTNVDYPLTNRYAWVIPQTPGVNSRVKVESALSATLASISAQFSIAGIRVLAPNGGESWRMDTLNTINWTEAAAGGGALVEFSYNNGATYTNVAGPGYPLVANTADYVPDFPSVQCRARVSASDAGVSNVTDASDAPFTVAGVKVTRPVTGDIYTMGVLTNGAIFWYSAGTLDDQVEVYYTPEDGREVQLLSTPNREVAPGDNQRDWTPAMSLDPSDRGHIRVFASSGTSGSYTGISQTFSVRGVRLTQPTTGTVFRIGTEETIRWLTAGFDSGVSAYFYLSGDGGTTYSPTPLIPLDSLLNIRSALWQPDASFDPTTNAVIKMVVTNAPIAFQAVSSPFLLRGIKVLSPAATNNWAIGSTNTIRFLSAAAGNLANVYYAYDGVNFDLARPIAENVTMPGGLSTVSWTIESFREPSPNARIKVQSTTLPDSAISEPFTVGGIKVVRPLATDIWSVSETNRIQWVAIGTQGTNTIQLIRPDLSVQTIVSGWTGAYYDWVVPGGTVGSNLVIRVIDVGGSMGDSQPFRIVSEPTVSIISPLPGDFWRLSDSYAIQWSRAGNMVDLFTVEYSLNDFATSIVIPGTAIQTNGIYSLPWTPGDPAKLGAAKIRVTNSNTNINDTSATFYLVPKLEIRSPNGGEDFYALKPTIVEWYTKGNVTDFDLYYSTDLTRGTGSWVKINTSGPVVGKGNEELSQYPWTVADVKSPVVWIRIQDAGYTAMYPASQPGPYDDCDATFAIKYYTINWHVYNAANTNELDQLSVTDSSGWSQSGLQANPYVVHEYPYGVFDTVWSREFFYDKVIFNWKPDPSRTIEVPMNQSEVAPDFRVMANFVFDATTQVFRVSSWLERGGRILDSASSCTITVFDGDGNTMNVLTGAAHDSAGVFWQSLPPTLEKGRTYFAKVDILFSGVTYSSGVTFQLRVPSGEDQAAQILALLASVNTNVTDLATAQAAFRASASAKLDTLTNIIGQITGLTNIEARLDALSTQTLARLDVLTNTIGVIGPSETNLIESVLAFREEYAQRSARLLTRPTTVKLGAGVNVLFRSRPGTTVTIVVSNLTLGAWRYTSTMSEMSGGVYEEYMTANWGTGDCLVACSDTLGGSDSMILKVVMTDLDDLAVALTNVSESLDQVELRVIGLAYSVSNIDFSVSGLATNLAELITEVADVYAVVSNLQSTINWSNVTDILGVVRGMSNEIAVLSTNFNAVNWTNLSALAGLGPQLADVMASVSNLQATINWSNVVTLLGAVDSISNRLGSLTNLPFQMEGVTTLLGQMGSLTNLGGQMSGLSNSVAQLSSLTNMAPQVGYLTNLLTSMSGVTNLTAQMAGVTNAIGQISVMTNFGPQLAYITNTMGVVAGLTNLTAQMAGVTNAIGQISTMTNFGPQIAYLTNAMAGVAGQEAYLTNLLTRMSGMTNLLPQMAYLTNVIDQVAFLTNLAPQVSVMTNAIGQISSLTNFGPQLAYMTNTMGAVIGLTNLTAQMAGVTNAIGQISSLTNFGAQLSYITNTLGTVASLTNLTAQMAGVTNAIGQISTMTNFGPQIAYLTNAMAALSGQEAYLTNLLTRMSGVTNLLPQMAYLTNVIDQVAFLTNLAPQVSVMTNAIGQISSLTNFGPQLAYMTNTMGAVIGLTNLSAQMAGVTNAIGQISTMTNFGSQIAYLTNVIGQVTAVTNLGPQVSYLTNLLTRMSGLTNIAPQISSLTNSVGQLGMLTNMPSQMLYLTNAVAQLGALTNLGSQIDVMTNAIGQLARLTNIPDQVAYLTNAISLISGVTNIPDQVSAMTNSIAQVARLTNMPDQVAYLTNVIAQISGVTNIPDQVAAMTNSIAQVARLTNVPDQVAYLTNVIAQLGGITNLGPQVAAMTNAIGQIASLTNLSDQVGYLTNAMGGLGGLTNLAGSMEYTTNLLGRMAGLTNLSDQVALLQATLDPLSALTNMPDRLGGIETLLSTLSGLTNLPEQVEALTNTIATLGSLTNLGATVNSLTNLYTQMADVTNAVSQISSLTNFGPQIAYLTNVIGQVSAVTNLGDQLSYLTNAMAQLGGLTNAAMAMEGQLDYVTNLLDRMSLLTNLPAQVEVLTNSIATLGSLTNLGATVDSLTNLFGEVALLTNLPAQVTALGLSMDALADLTNLPERVGGLTNAVAELAALTNMGGRVDQILGNVTNLLADMALVSSGVSNLQATIVWTDVVSIAQQVAGISNNLSTLATAFTDVNWTNLAQISTLGETVSNISSSVDALRSTVNWTNVLDILDTVSSLSNNLSTLSGTLAGVNWTNMTELGTKMDGVYAAVTGLQGVVNWDDITTLLGTGSGISNTVTLLKAQIDAVNWTNLASIGPMSASVSNIFAVVTNLQATLQWSDIASLQLDMTNLAVQLGPLTNMPDLLAGLTNLPAQMDRLTNMPDQLAGLTNMPDLLAGLTNMPADLAYLTNVITTNMAGQLAGLTNLPAQMDRLTNMPADLAYLTNAITTNMAGQLAGLTNLPAQVATLTGMPVRLATLTNLPAQMVTLTNMPSQMITLSNAWASLQQRIGTDLDPVSTNTVFGRLALLVEQLGGVGGAANNAATIARSAKTQASTAAGAASAVRTQLEKAQFSRMLGALDQMRTALDATLQQVKGIPDAMSTENLVKSLRDTMGKIDEIAKQRGVDLGQPTDVAPGSFSDPKAVAKLLNTISETKAMMEAMRLLMDEAVNKPVVVDWLESPQ